MTRPFIVLTEDGAVIAPVTANVPFIVTALFSRSIKSISPVRPMLLALSKTSPILPEPPTSSVYWGLEFPIPSLD